MITWPALIMDGEWQYKHGQWGKRFPSFGRWCLLCHLSAWFWGALRTVPTIVTAHILCAYEGSRATRKKCTTRRTRGLVLSPVSLGGSSYFLWKRCVVFQQMKNNFYLPCQFFENRRSMRMLLFLRMIDLTEHFIVKQKSILKHQKLLLQDVTLRAWVLKNP